MQPRPTSREAWAAFPRPKPPVDQAGLHEVERLAAELEDLARPLGIRRQRGESVGDAAHREAWAEERATGMSLRTRALHDVAVANGEIFGAREAAGGMGGRAEVAGRLAAGEREMERARRSVARACEQAAIAAE